MGQAYGKTGLKVDGVETEWNNLESLLRLLFHIKPTEAELKTIEHIVVLQIDSKGNALTVPSGRYNESTGMVTFTTTHLADCCCICFKDFFRFKSFAWARTRLKF